MANYIPIAALGIVVVTVIGIGIDRGIRQRERPIFALGSWITTGGLLLSLAGLMLWNPVPLVVLGILIAIVGGGVTAYADAKDQLDGKIRLFGDWWEGFDNNLWDNAKAILSCVVAVFAVLFMWVSHDERLVKGVATAQRALAPDVVAEHEAVAQASNPKTTVAASAQLPAAPCSSSKQTPPKSPKPVHSKSHHHTTARHIAHAS